MPKTIAVEIIEEIQYFLSQNQNKYSPTELSRMFGVSPYSIRKIDTFKLCIQNNRPWNKGKKGVQTHTVSEETRKKIGAANKINTKRLWEDPEFRKNQIEKRKGKPSWNKGKSGYLSEESRKKISNAGKGRPQRNQNSVNNLLNYIRPKGMIPWNKGKSVHLSPKTEFKKGVNTGEKNHNWRGGSTPKSKLIRNSSEYKKWRISIFERDNFTCQECGQRGGKLNADHIKPFSIHPELRFELSNGRTLCVPCHKNTPTYGWRILKNHGRKTA